jgi:hypothetical protein
MKTQNDISSFWMTNCTIHHYSNDSELNAKSFVFCEDTFKSLPRVKTARLDGVREAYNRIYY